MSISEKLDLSMPISSNLLDARIGTDGVLTIYLPEKVFETVNMVTVKNLNSTIKKRVFKETKKNA